MGKNMKKSGYMCTHNRIIFLYTWKLAQHCKSTMLQYKTKIKGKNKKQKKQINSFDFIKSNLSFRNYKNKIKF